MLLFASLHVHATSTESVVCDDCLSHHCTSHLSVCASDDFECVLCAFLSLPVLTTSPIVFSAFATDVVSFRLHSSHILLPIPTAVVVIRGPPMA